MPHRFPSDRLGIYPYFAEVGLERFDFSQQPKAVDLVVQWLTGWIERLFEKKIDLVEFLGYGDRMEQEKLLLLYPSPNFTC